MSTSTINIDTTAPEVLQELMLIGKVPSMFCEADPRFSYALYIPLRYQTLQNLPLVVLIHSSDRMNGEIRDAFVDFAESNGCAVFCPLFPRFRADPLDRSSYKVIAGNNIRYDNILLSMIGEMASWYPKVDTEKFFMYGFSGGAQFSHRFAYLHPEKLLALVVAGPGVITRPDEESHFPQGIQDLDALFNVHFEWETLKTVPTAFICGDQDTDNVGNNVRGRPPVQGGRYGTLKRFEEVWASLGGTSQFISVRGAGHEEFKILPYSQAFFGEVLRRSSGEKMVQ
ncbi:hypothetical protein B7494_g533 [Chlorociboria aeruginascens]|nr:hypothetical protein B7494_g533 [Chlorociboria aeruginascens]